MPLQRLPNLGKANALKDFPDKKVGLRRRQVLGDEVRVNAQTKLCLNIVRRFGLNHDLGQHCFLKGLRNEQACASAGESTMRRDSSDDAIARRRRQIDTFAEANNRPAALAVILGVLSLLEGSENGRAHRA
jgi:hypothetical protein